MVEVVLFLLIFGGYLYYKYKEHKRNEEHREMMFRIQMLALEEKSKREGAFKVSYFDKGDKK